MAIVPSAQPLDMARLGARSRLAGLDRRSLGRAEVTAQSVSVMAPCAAGATVPLLIAESGATLVGSIVVAVFLAGLVSRVLTEFASRLAAPGALYTYAAKGLGPAAGFATAAAMILGYGALAMFTLTESATYLLRVVGVDRPPTAVLVAAIVTIGAGSSVVLLRGIRASARVSLVVEVVAVTILVVVAVTVVVTVRGGVDLSVLAAAPTGPTDFATGVALATCALIGFESAASLSVEARAPLRSVPSAIRGSLVFGAVVVLVVAVAQDVARGSGTSPGDGNLDVLVARVADGWFAPVVDLGVVASFLACTLACVTALARLLLSLSREGLLPGRVGSTHVRFKTPVAAITAAMTVIVAVPVTIAACGVGLRPMVGSLAAAPVIGFITSYVIVSVAAPFFLHRVGELRARAVLVAAGAALSFGFVGIVFVGATVDSAWGMGAIGALVWFLAAAAIYVVLRLRRPRRLAGIGVHDTPTRADLWSGHTDRTAP
ncbi:APC family permease [Williamsia serinedens]|uniref:Amino acid transporter n=1 Tax=Williamsia serinedens TaxID=391736 RepID=A0ABT1GWS0_9NOCA|nr:APC family permease [Williamsia serinedens]MCP2159433.1 Amino acid transporter [Williamsia serinedens]